MFNWLRRIFQGKTPFSQLNPITTQRPTAPSSSLKSGPQPASTPAAPEAPTRPTGGIRSSEQARVYLDKVRSKINLLAEDFADGKINRSQFQDLYAHYEDEIQTIEAMLTMAPESDEWKHAVTEGQSVMIRRKHNALVHGFSIYMNDSGMPVKSLGQFGVDPALFVPMLSSYRAATQEIFGAGVRSTEIEGGEWLSFIPGKLTTTLTLFTSEPSARQLKALGELQKLFENANAARLASEPVDSDSLFCPHEFFLTHPL